MTHKIHGTQNKSTEASTRMTQTGRETCVSWNKSKKGQIEHT